MRLVTARLKAIPTAALPLVCVAVLAVALPVSALADEPVAGDPTTVTTTTTPAVQVTPDGDLVPVVSSAPTALPIVPSTSDLLAKFRAKALKRLKARIAHYQKTTQKWDLVMGVPFHLLHQRTLASLSLNALRHAAQRQEIKAKATRRQALHPPHLTQFTCIHHYEGSWTDGGPPYYGGLQMDLSFQRTYAPHLLRTKGTADHWTPLEQIWAAERAERTRGFWPWPNTARFCGLL